MSTELHVSTYYEYLYVPLVEVHGGFDRAPVAVVLAGQNPQNPHLAPWK